MVGGLVNLFSKAVLVSTHHGVLERHVFVPEEVNSHQNTKEHDWV